MGIVRKIFEEKESPLLQRLKALDKARAERVVKNYAKKIKKAVAVTTAH